MTLRYFGPCDSGTLGPMELGTPGPLPSSYILLPPHIWGGRVREGLGGNVQVMSKFSACWLFWLILGIQLGADCAKLNRKVMGGKWLGYLLKW